MTPITPSELTGSTIRLLLTKRRCTQTDLARALGVTQPAISARLRGSVAFDINELVAVAEFLDVPLPSLLPADKAAS